MGCNARSPPTPKEPKCDLRIQQECLQPQLYAYTHRERAHVVQGQVPLPQRSMKAIVTISFI